MNDSELEVMLNRAAEKGAEKALKSIGHLCKSTIIYENLHFFDILCGVEA